MRAIPNFSEEKSRNEMPGETSISDKPKGWWQFKTSTLSGTYHAVLYQKKHIRSCKAIATTQVHTWHRRSGGPCCDVRWQRINTCFNCPFFFNKRQKKTALTMGHTGFGQVEGRILLWAYFPFPLTSIQWSTHPSSTFIALAIHSLIAIFPKFQR